MQRVYAYPTIEALWSKQHDQLIAAIRAEGRPVVLAGDGRNDSPGHFAQYLTYSLMDSKSRSIVALEVSCSLHIKMIGLRTLGYKM